MSRSDSFIRWKALRRRADFIRRCTGVDLAGEIAMGDAVRDEGDLAQRRGDIPRGHIPEQDHEHGGGGDADAEWWRKSAWVVASASRVRCFSSSSCSG